MGGARTEGGREGGGGLELAAPFLNIISLFESVRKTVGGPRDGPESARSVSRLGQSVGAPLKTANGAT